MDIKGFPLTERANLALSEADIAALTGPYGVSLSRLFGLSKFTGLLFAQCGYSADEAVDTLNGLVSELDLPDYVNPDSSPAPATRIINGRTRSAYEIESRISAEFGGYDT